MGCINFITPQSIFIMRKFLTKNEVLEAIDLYKSGLNSSAVSRKFNVSSVCIDYHLKKFNIVKHSKSKCIKRYFCDESYFEKIDSSDKAYFLGFMYADGNINPLTGRIVINLQERDKDILLKLKESINYTGELLLWKKQPPRQNQYALCFTNKKMVNDLINLGVTYSNKSFNLDYPYFIDDKYQLDFIRGFFDGDGCISRSKKWAVKLHFVGTENMLKGVNYYFDKLLNVPSKVRDCTEGKYSDEIIKNLAVDKKSDIYKVMSTWYSNTSLYLQRKYDKYYECFIVEELHNLDKIRALPRTRNLQFNLDRFDLTGEYLCSYSNSVELIKEGLTPIEAIDCAKLNEGINKNHRYKNWIWRKAE